MIPKIIHQSWKVHQVPDRWLGFQRSWRDHHPDFEYRFWTDADNRAFVAREYPDLLPIYDGYRHAISRADHARYLVVCHYGGLYVDMDFEALRPIDDLLAGRSLVFGMEPQSHLDNQLMKERGYGRLLCNALFASVPRHPFWKHLLPLIKAAKDETNVLGTAGPHVLTRAYESYPRQSEITLVPSPLLYPIDHFLKPNDEPCAGDEPGPYAIHHWAGTWWRDTLMKNAFDRIVAARKKAGNA